jgi:hypothetical protein
MNAKLSIAVGAAILGAALQANAATLPQAKTENGVTYINGGVGQDEAAAMKAEARHYPMSVIFSAGKDNAYLANVKLTVKDKAGKELLSTAAGPITLVKLPAGTYALSAELRGATLHRTVHVSGKGDRQVVFHWPKA